VNERAARRRNAARASVSEACSLVSVRARASCLLMIAMASCWDVTSYADSVAIADVSPA